MSYQFVTTEIHQKHTAIVRFDRGMAANPLSAQLMEELTQVAMEFDSRTDIRTVILTGRSDNFSMGVDLKDPARQQPLGLLERRQQLKRGPRLCAAWENLEVMTVAAIEGWCIGGGVALAVSLDLRVASEKSILYTPEIERGMNMSWGSVPRISNLIGPARAKRLVILAEKTAALTCLDWGLVDYLTTPGKALDKAIRLAEHIAGLPPVAVRMCKQGIEAAAKPLNNALSVMDMDQFGLAQTSQDYREGIAAFIEHRPPNFTGE